jgi:hypothetical protein
VREHVWAGWAEGERREGARGRGHGPESAQPGWGKWFSLFLFFSNSFSLFQIYIHIYSFMIFSRCQK